MTTTNATIPRQPFRGSRPSVHVSVAARVGVDAGLMTIAGGNFPSMDDLGWEAGVADNAATSSTGYGDGLYDVVVAKSPMGGFLGLEVVFLDDEYEGAEWDDDGNLIAGETVEREVGKPVVLGMLSVAGRLGVGDPCYGGPSFELDVPEGPYVAVAWMDAEDEVRVARLAVYRQ